MPKALAKKGKPAATRKGEGKKRNVNNSSSKKERKPRSETYVVCPYTDQKVWISKATVSDLKPSGKNTSNIHKNDSKKRLWTISSSQIRHDHYAEVAQALSIYEQNLLPSSGGRSWEVTVQLSEPNARILFRSWKGRMEVRMQMYCIVLYGTLLYCTLPIRHELFSRVSYHCLVL